MENIVDLCSVSEESVLDNIRTRFQNDDIYTWAGSTLLAVNPYKFLEKTYSEIAIQSTINTIKNGATPLPHIFSVAAKVNQLLCSHFGNKNQAILVSGESGAGKTSSVNHILQLLNYTNSSQPALKDTYARISYANPILEAFGNACTRWNPNSSRFGKLIIINYLDNVINGNKIHHYLLEKTRVVHVPFKERNFHVFYQLMSGLSEDELTKLNLNKYVQFKLMPGQWDTQECSIKFQKLKDCFNRLQVSNDTQWDIFNILSSILLLGELDFQLLNDSIIFKDDSNLSGLSEMLGIEIKALVQLLTSHVVSLQRRASVFKRQFTNVAECEISRNCLIKLLYTRLFDWIVLQLQYHPKNIESDKSQMFGILDIFGFESFDVNYLEQLCINYANEKIQQFYVSNFLKEQHKMLVQEGINLKLDWKQIDHNCLDLLDSGVSIFGIINEISHLKLEVTPSEVCRRLGVIRNNSQLLLDEKHALQASFGIKHYAGTVVYSTKDIVEKNMDRVPENFLGVLSASSKGFIRAIFTDNTTINDKKVRHGSVLSRFKNSVNEMLSVLKMCDVHYVKCIKSNPFNETMRFDDDYVLEQLKRAGTVQSVAIARAGFPFNLPIISFYDRYRRLAPKSIKVDKDRCKLKRNGDNKENIPPKKKKGHYNLKSVGLSSNHNISAILKLLPVKSWYHVGTSRVFLNEKAVHHLDQLLTLKLSRCVRVIQRRWRLVLNRRAAIVLQKHVRCFLKRKRFLAMKRAVYAIQCWYSAILKSRRKLTEKLNEAESKIHTSLDRHFQRRRSMVSVRRLPQVPIKFIVKKRLLPGAEVLPWFERPMGLSDAL